MPHGVIPSRGIVAQRAAGVKPADVIPRDYLLAALAAGVSLQAQLAVVRA
jgi:hypothetical protein